MSEKKIILKGRKVIGGLVEGEPLSKVPTMGWRNIDYQRCVITERGHPLEGIPLKERVFVFPTPRGSGGWSWYGRTRQYGTNPAAIVYWKGNALTVNGAMLMDVPTVGDCDQNPAEVIDTGDWVKVDADRGIVEITKKRS